ncbi:pseudouridine synthase [Corynebacterium sp. P5848]|uniref:pseudouridine synthase n=1 Tax=Corynebacterium marambiense TaxID=2765364 RepID=UPI002260D0FD|nr:pseudouridine synthase [Corynebacterium marambiense]MCX7542862.1 pseudouridine synthase [Corynebacterium marambiense]
MSMGKRIVQRRRRQAPLPIRDGLNPSRARLPDDAAPMTALAFVTELVTTQTHRATGDDAAAIHARFAAGEVVDPQGRPLPPDRVLAPGQDVWFYRTPAPETPVPGKCRIIHHDEHLLVVHKPHFLATMPRGRHITETAVVRLRRATGNQDLTPAHRLDRLTSGILVLTCDPAVRGAYQQLFSSRGVHKTYRATATLLPDLADAVTRRPVTWEHRMQKARGRLQAYLEHGEPNARTTVSAVTPVNDEEQATLESLHGPLPRQAHYTLHPATGRTHQLRLHMLTAGVPILGDPLYPDVLPEDAEDFRVPMHLTATALEFTDPISGQPRAFTAIRD